jgi:dihydroorotase-like cyclic amidohydrolase
MSLVIRNARVRGYQQFVDIAIEGDRVSAIGPKLPTKAAKELDAFGSLVLPGLFNAFSRRNSRRFGSHRGNPG